MEAYLDNAATTQVYESVKDIIIKTLTLDYGNPSSMHKKGMEAEIYIKNAKEIIAKSLKVEPKEIIFTSGGTEANNLALIGGALANKRQGNHIITTKIEHSSVHNSLLYLEENGFRITFLSVDEKGHISMEELQSNICEDTILVSIMYVNNEIGALLPISEIGKLIKQKNPNTLFHVDAIQGYGKYNIYPKRESIDLLSISGHKIHAPKGIGALYIKDKVKIKPILFGGGQERSIRSGTENLSGIAGLGQAAIESYKDLDSKREHLYHIKSTLIELLQDMDGVVINGVGEDIKKSAPHILSISFRGIKSEVLLHALEERGVYVSAGSACSSNHPALSGTLKAIHVEDALLDSTIRFSFSGFTTLEEIKYAASCLKEIVPALRRYIKH